MGQTFRTRPENALDLALYSAEDLRYDPGVARFPAAILLEAGGPEASSVAHSAVQSQSTLATIGGLAKGGTPVIKPLKQKIQVGTTAYELQEIFGIEGQPVDGRILTQTLT